MAAKAGRFCYQGLSLAELWACDKEPEATAGDGQRQGDQHDFLFAPIPSQSLEGSSQVTRATRGTGEAVSRQLSGTQSEELCELLMTTQLGGLSSKEQIEVCGHRWR